MQQVILTRTPEQNSKMAQLLADDLGLLGVGTHCLPLLEAVPLEKDQSKINLILQLDLFDKIIFISRNAVKYGIEMLLDYWPDWPLSLEWYAVGPATAKALFDYDKIASIPAEASSEGVLAMAEMQQLMGQKILIVRGEGGRETLKKGLSERGAEVTYLEAYRRQEVAQQPIQLPSSETWALVYSGEALQYFSLLLAEQKTQIGVIVPSNRLALMARDLGFGKVELAASQEDQDMAQTLKDQYR